MTWFWLELISINVNPQDGVKYDNKALMVVTLMSGRRIRGGYAEYEELSGKRKDCYRQSEMVEQSASHKTNLQR